MARNGRANHAGGSIHGHAWNDPSFWSARGKAGVPAPRARRCPLTCRPRGPVACWAIDERRLGKGAIGDHLSPFGTKRGAPADELLLPPAEVYR